MSSTTVRARIWLEVVVAKGLLHPQRNPFVIGEHRGQLILVASGPMRPRCRRRFGGGLVARDHHQEQERHDLVITEAVTVDLGLDECRGQIVGGLLRRCATMSA